MLTAHETAGIRKVLDKHNRFLCSCLLAEACRQAGRDDLLDAATRIQDLAAGHLSLAYLKVPGLIVFAPDDDAIGRVFKKGGAEDDHMQERSLSLTRPGDRVVDAGANAGGKTLPFAHAVGPAGKVYAFEPHPYNCSVLRKNLILTGLADRVEVFEKALSFETAPKTLYLSPDSVGNNGDHRLWPDETEDRLAIPVEGVRLDEALAGVRIDHLKIDVQGCEVEVLSGATGLLAGPLAPEHMSVEVWPKGLHGGGQNAEKLLSALLRLGYTLYVHQPDYGWLKMDPPGFMDFALRVAMFAGCFDVWCEKKRAR